MGAKQSEEMRKVKRLVIDKGLTVYAAVKKVGGITGSAVYMSGWYKEWSAKQNDISTK